MHSKKPQQTALIVALNLFALALSAQSLKENWYNLDLEKDSVFGVSVERTYNELLKGKPSKTVIVAVLDGGTDINHEDLKDVLWTNEDEIPNNGVDDDKNGYIDDVHGWNFIGGKDGKNVKEDTYEYVRMYKELSKKWGGFSSARRDPEYKLYQKVKEFYEKKTAEAHKAFEGLTRVVKSIDSIDQVIGKDSITLDDLKGMTYKGKYDSAALATMRTYLQAGMTVNFLKTQLRQGIEYYTGQLEKQMNPDFNPRPIVGDNYEDLNERFYGNNDVVGPTAGHGSHVAGIIAAKRYNGVGINGVADNVRIMVLRVVPDGDERDKDIANAIRYAVDNGATVINMSFGKAFSPHKEAIDRAVEYAAGKDVLLIHAAGNEGKNNDDSPNFPNDRGLSSTALSRWMDVGANWYKDNEKLTASFSNYGKHTVDVFAPGHQINSTTPGSSYAIYSGTSMSAPCTAGVAAMIRSYYPGLSAKDVRKILIKSCVRVKHEVNVPGTKDKKTRFKKLCRSKGIINAYRAVELAERKAKR
jgi:subtilisin family serine protease